jgi:hypothetical protein
LGKWRYSSTFLTLALDGGEWSASHPSHFTPRETAPGTHWIGGWVGPRAGLDAVVKRKIPSPCQDSNPNHPAHSSVLYHQAISKQGFKNLTINSKKLNIVNSSFHIYNSTGVSLLERLIIQSYKVYINIYHTKAQGTVTNKVICYLYQYMHLIYQVLHQILDTFLTIKL